MKKKINSRFMCIGLLSIVITTVVMTIVFYARLKEQVFSDLSDIADFVVATSDYEIQIEDIRITYIAHNGEVIYDSKVDVDAMENHGERPEVVEANKEGDGKSIRKSDTLSESLYYYARKTDDGSVIRVCKEADNVVSMLLSTLPQIIVMAVVLMIICMYLTRYLAAEITRPIENMVEDMDRTDEGDIYEELEPFVRKIRMQHEEILSAVNMRQEFTANVTHELKTPLAAISGYAELMEAGMASDDDVKHFSQEIRKSAARLLSLIEDILKLSQMDAGEVEKVLEYVNIAQVAKDTVEMLSIGAKKNNVRVSYVGCDEADIRIGKEFAEELAYNLIENAIRYNKPNGHVIVSVKVKKGKIIFTVKDTGIGIPKEHQERIFERFYRVDKSRSKELGGTGLGLAIVKHICNITRADIKLQSEADKGTVISVKWLG